MKLRNNYSVHVTNIVLKGTENPLEWGEPNYRISNRRSGDSIYVTNGSSLGLVTLNANFTYGFNQ